MTDPPADPGPDVDPDLEVASALHDGAATADERARAQDPAVRAARARIAAVSARVADVPPPPAGLLDAHVAAAVAGLDAGAGAGANGAGSVAALADRRPWWQRAPLGAVAAAVAVVALVGAISVAVGGDDPSEDTATAALDSLEDGSSGDASGPSEADMGGDTTLRASEREAFATYEELAVVIAGRLSTAAPTSSAAAEEEAPTGADAAPTAEVEAESTPPLTPEAGACDPVAAAGLDPGSVQMVTSVVVDGQPIMAVVHDDGSDPVLTSVDETSCTVTDRRPLPRS